MDSQYKEMRDHLNDMVDNLGGRSTIRSGIETTIKLAQEGLYRALTGDLASSCKIPTGVDGSGQIIHCNSPATQASHSIQRTLLVSISDPGLGADGLEAANSQVLEVFPMDPGYWQNIALKHDRVWNIDRVPPKPQPPRSASTRPFACKDHDGKTFEKIESNNPLKFPEERAILTFSSSEPHGLEDLDEQLFLVAYRALLFDQDLLQALQRSLSLPIQDQSATNRDVRDQLHRNRLTNVDPVSLAVDHAKSAYDARLLGLRPLKLTHRLIPIQTAASTTITTIIMEKTPSGNIEHIALTLWPTDIRNREHWLILSYPEDHVEWAPRMTDDIQASSVASQQSAQAKVDWLVRILKDSRNAYVNPSHYWSLPESARDSIEGNLVKYIIESSIEWVTEVSSILQQFAETMQADGGAITDQVADKNGYS